MSDDHVKRLRDARKWFNNDGQCCGQVDSVGTCAAPACIFGEALKEFYQAADRIEAQAARIAELEAALATARREGMEEAAQMMIDLRQEPIWEENPKYGQYIVIRNRTPEEIAAAIRAAAKEGK